MNTAISNWTYSLNGGNFGSAVPTGVTRSGNTVTINPVTATFDTFTIKAADATVSDVFTISENQRRWRRTSWRRCLYCVSYERILHLCRINNCSIGWINNNRVIVYKGINKITPTSITVGTKPTGLSSSVSGSVITLTATTALASKSGNVPITIQQMAKHLRSSFLTLYLSKGNRNRSKGLPPKKSAIPFLKMEKSASGWSGTRPTPKAGWYMWTRTRFKYTDNTYSAYFYLVAQQGKDAIIISATPPTNPARRFVAGSNDATSTVYSGTAQNGYIGDFN